ncbi:aminodeoxychorismate lyase [Ferriphaselus sp. R-1]|uniref:aminodeoxychorismate lyase n=1 Tax=Ferriphaselus sp. R-1 TaxID=1485544 RepID=UPI0005594BC3|nr:aminodeoxychorismate lyase [Ferriphaselus sp. R-1]
MLINGLPGESISAADRGLMYGDGVFRTMRLLDRRIVHWSHHYRKLQQDCSALLLPCPDARLLETEIEQLAWEQPDGVVRLTLTRGIGPRGYAPPAAVHPTRLLSLSPLPASNAAWVEQGVRLYLCELRMSAQLRLAGVKHLNRLENVLAAAEWNDPAIAEGLLRDEAGRVIGGVRSNLFCWHGGVLLTPDLSRCGVAGVQRQRILEWALHSGQPLEVRELPLDEVLAAEEVFVCNSVFGLWPVRELAGRSWLAFPRTRALAAALEALP